MKILSDSSECWWIGWSRGHCFLIPSWFLGHNMRGKLEISACEIIESPTKNLSHFFWALSRNQGCSHSCNGQRNSPIWDLIAHNEELSSPWRFNYHGRKIEDAQIHRVADISSGQLEISICRVCSRSKIPYLIVRRTVVQRSPESESSIPRIGVHLAKSITAFFHKMHKRCPGIRI